MRAPSAQPDGGHRGSQSGSPAPPLLGHSPPPGLDFLPPHAGMADPSSSAESRWGHQPARDSDGTAALPRGSRGAARPRPCSTFGGAPGAPAPLDAPAAPRDRPRLLRQRARGAGRPGPPTGTPKPNGTHKLQRELFL
ncbi:translation initiation factor IF-2-like isoform X2 [Myiozetetes cayanensis]|uniref:translation initiation factor IF-2-like isoform X2 n=1 Tax=Myiozetetes cayanensis TaxID=478635 RepID=UPI00215E7F12|nr:translation initiation factor IF-2-like isoform X2 [Myiozetetes cayanensis]